MNVEYKDFIAVYHNVYPEGYCEHLVTEFERLIEAGAGYSRQKSENEVKHKKNDLQLCLNIGVHSIGDYKEKSSVNWFFQGLQNCYEQYTEEFSILKNDRIAATAMKMQRTDPGGGYHIWHSEQGNGAFSDRVLVYMLYLNTLSFEDAGETEFLYQKRRINPTKNTMVIWPASFTHAHRGNTVLSHHSKYIVTGWFYYE
jgi:hypothetical protein